MATTHHDDAPTQHDNPDAQLTDLGYEPQLKRQLSFGELVVYGLLFFVPMAPVAVFGPVVNRSGGVPALVYLVAAIVMGFSAVSYREMALRFPVAGSVYGYSRLALGKGLGFIAGWLILLDYILMPALLTVLSAVALAHILPNVPIAAIAAVFVIASILVNLRGVGIATWVGKILLGIQLIVIAFFVGCVIAGIARGDLSFTMHPLWRGETTWIGVFSAVSIASFSYLGFDAVATLNEEATRGGKAVARATLVLLGLLALLFSVQVFAAELVSDSTGFPAGDSTARAFYLAVDAICPSWFIPVFTMTNAFVAIFACLIVAHSSTSRLVFAMARDGLLPRQLATTNSAHVPAAAVISVGILTAIVSMSFAEHAETMTTLVTFGALSSYVLLNACVIVQYFVKEKTGNWLVHLVVPVLGIVTLIIALANTAILTKIIGLSWLALGLVVAGVRWCYRHQRRRHQSSSS